MKPIGIGAWAAFTAVLLTIACGGGDGTSTTASGGVGLFSDDSAVSVEDIRSQMKDGADPMRQRMSAEADLYQPQASIALDVVASGSYTLAALAEEAKTRLERQGETPFAACLIMAGLTDAIQASSAEEAIDAILGDYEELLDLMAGRGIPVVVCEIPPIVAEYGKPGYAMPPTGINSLIGQVNDSLYGLALDKAAGFVFASRVLAPRIGTGKDSVLINEANSGNRNGVQPTFEGMRLLCQLYAYGLHKAGYRGGRILVLGDTRVADEALTRKIDRIEFLLPKYLEIELHKTCP